MSTVPNLCGTRDQCRGRQSFHGTGAGGGGGMVQAVMRVMGSSGELQMKLSLLPTAHLLLCGPVPNRPQTNTGPQPGGWGPLLYVMCLLHIFSPKL